jgi:hypothetical protein
MLSGAGHVFGPMPPAARAGGRVHLGRLLGGHDRARELPPALASLRHFLARLGGRAPVASRPDRLGHRTRRGEGAWYVPR